MNVKITKNINEANLITHDSKFHPDDIFSTVLLSKIIKNPVLYRTSNVPENTNAIIYDVGFGKFDHHGPNAKMRTEKIKYCSFGLLWEEYGKEYLKSITNSNIDDLHKVIEEKLVMQINGIDNGVFPTITADYELTDLDKIIDMFNQTWDEEPNFDEAFLKALNIAEIIFDNVLRNEISKMKAKEIVLSKIDTVENNILILDKYIPYNDAVFSSSNPKAKDIKVVILPSNRGGYCVKPITVSKESKELLINFPKEYFGLHDEELQKISGIKTARFVHSTGFLGTAETLEDAILLAKKALENKE